MGWEVTPTRAVREDMKIFLIVLICVILAWLVYSLFFKKRKTSVISSCSFCGNESRYGYAEYPRDIKGSRPVCRKCLVSRLEEDYSDFSGRAVVFQPISGTAGYIFHRIKDWEKSFRESKIDDDARSYLLRMDTACHDCGQRANFLWIESNGLTQYNFGNILKKGFAETLLPMNPKPISLCGRCCVTRIAKELEENEITYLEVVAPKGTEDGFVMPMAY